MPLTESDKAELLQFLNSPLFAKAKEQVLDKIDGPIYNLAAPEQSMALAQEKGARNAFRVLRKVCRPASVSHGAPVLAQSISRKPTNK
jgi:hypothetical protein